MLVETNSRSARPNPAIEWPEGKEFAFTMVDDTDCSTVENTKPVYDLLAENGLLTTKTVWPLSESERPISGGDSLENPCYRDWVLNLNAAGFEIAMHGVADGSSCREKVGAGFKYFREVIGEDPSIYTNHVGQAEGIYWGAARFDPPLRWIYESIRRGHRREVYAGADLASPHFWGDHCQRSKYVRNLVFADINTLKMDPLMPYHDPSRPHVRNWFSSSYGSSVEAFCRLISEANQDRLLREGGACIVYTHLGSTFHPLSSDLKRLVRRLGALPGWFVPATTLLDFIGSRRGWLNVAQHRLDFQLMQWNWFRQRARREIENRLCGLKTSKSLRSNRVHATAGSRDT
jgi:hypothetical protein